MNASDILKRVDHTQLKQFADWDSIETLCTEAERYGTASVCIPPCYVKRARAAFPTLNIGTVIGFPNGYSTTPVKVFEASQAIFDGADEVDMVINITDVKNGDFQRVLDEIKAVRAATEGHILKVIIETCFLGTDEKIKMCDIVTQSGADYIKTSTGFGTAGATVEDIKLFRDNIGPSLKIKAAGGMKTLADVETFAELGCDRLGTSSALKLLKGEGALDY